jgi:hypothetical protein
MTTNAGLSSQIEEPTTKRPAIVHDDWGAQQTDSLTEGPLSDRKKRS